VTFDVLKETKIGTVLARWIKLNQNDEKSQKTVKMARKLIDR